MSLAPKSLPAEQRFLNGALEYNEQPDLAEPRFLPVPTDTTFFHLTHWKAGSQWVRIILTDLYGPATVAPEYFELQLLARPILPGKVYLCAYLSKQEFNSLSIPGRHRRIVLIRDFRDTLISAYFSLRYSHQFDLTKTPGMQKWRIILSRLNNEDGLMYVLECGVYPWANIQRSWLESGEPVFRLEDCMTDTCSTLAQMFERGWGLRVDRQRLEEVVSRNRFEKLSGGRERGQEDIKSHYRKGVHGDWQNHFTPAITRRFKQLYGDLLVLAGYERGIDW
jgi:Sulfotransferase domain